MATQTKKTKKTRTPSEQESHDQRKQEKRLAKERLAKEQSKKAESGSDTDAKKAVSNTDAETKKTASKPKTKKTVSDTSAKDKKAKTEPKDAESSDSASEEKVKKKSNKDILCEILENEDLNDNEFVQKLKFLKEKLTTLEDLVKYFKDEVKTAEKQVLKNNRKKTPTGEKKKKTSWFTKCFPVSKANQKLLNDETFLDFLNENKRQEDELNYDPESEEPHVTPVQLKMAAVAYSKDKYEVTGNEVCLKNDDENILYQLAIQDSNFPFPEDGENMSGTLFQSELRYFLDSSMKRK